MTPEKVKHNLDLWSKRRQGYVHSHIFSIRTKPTRHKQLCASCSKQFEVGDRQIIANTGETLYGYATKGAKSGFSVMPKWMPRRILSASDKPMIIFHKKYYYHPDCFACYVNKQFIRGQLHGILNHSLCEKCEHKFSCFTGEIHHDIHGCIF